MFCKASGCTYALAHCASEDGQRDNPCAVLFSFLVFVGSCCWLFGLVDARETCFGPCIRNRPCIVRIRPGTIARTVALSLADPVGLTQKVVAYRMESRLFRRDAGTPLSLSLFWGIKQHTETDGVDLITVHHCDLPSLSLRE